MTPAVIPWQRKSWEDSFVWLVAQGPGRTGMEAGAGGLRRPGEENSCRRGPRMTILHVARDRAVIFEPPQAVVLMSGSRTGRARPVLVTSYCAGRGRSASSALETSFCCPGDITPLDVALPIQLFNISAFEMANCRME